MNGNLPVARRLKLIEIALKYHRRSYNGQKKNYDELNQHFELNHDTVNERWILLE